MAPSVFSVASGEAAAATSSRRRALSKRRIVFTTIGVVFLGLMGFRVFEALSSAGAGPAGRNGRPATLVETGTVEILEVHEAISAVGSLRAKERVDVTPRVSGRLVERRVDLGDAIAAGEVVARLDDDEIRQQVQQAEASLRVSRAAVEQRQAELENAELELERASGLLETGLIAPQGFEQVRTRRDVARSQVNLARAQVAQAEAGLEELRIRLEQTRVLAPISGVVGRRLVDVGALVSQSTPIVTLLNLSAVYLVANVGEHDLTRVGGGDAATVSVDALPAETFAGIVVRISPLLDPQTRTGQVEIEIPNPDRHLRAEMFARASIELASTREALTVPRAAMVYRGEQAGVYLIEEDAARFQPVETGTNVGDRVEVREGLANGQEVVTLGANVLRDGDPVRVDGGTSTRETGP